jgi:hypothetical protein
MFTSYEQYKFDLLQSANLLISSHCAPLYIEKGSRFVFNGSSILCKSINKYFLVTASHVIRDFHVKNVFTIGRGTKLVSLHPVNERNRYIDTGRTNNHCDVEILELDPNIIDLISERFVFLEESNVRLNPFLYDPKLDFLVNGLPAALTNDPVKYKQNNVKYFGLPTRLSEFKWYDKLGYTFGQHIMVEMPKKLAQPIKGNNYNMIKPYGMSGGGLWVIPDQIVEFQKAPFYQLVGILIEHVTNGHRCMIATNIGYAYELMRKAFNAEFSTKFSVNFNLENKKST